MSRPTVEQARRMISAVWAIHEAQPGRDDPCEENLWNAEIEVSGRTVRLTTVFGTSSEEHLSTDEWMLTLVHTGRDTSKGVALGLFKGDLTRFEHDLVLLLLAL